jgi:hypothetical protein
MSPELNKPSALSEKVLILNIFINLFLLMVIFYSVAEFLLLLFFGGRWVDSGS